ncbi:hypothetical protein SAMN05192558_116113 [Actinokineospora alba]|uniref:Uncharacterized protein n=1 Tax=Actinokineospora alba TaxID=504798 RepID=A0A1H0VZW1_9PSEU|nr:hypothetical protein C8E96_2562 [Actinokineospora alba]SDJ48133.1 hypothetical protein SAMN05421871_116114 [Actinokineospora alba]SDP83974.1 hypothetical protein SAMN05192558_116113 [Actinokineospora alba]
MPGLPPGATQPIPFPGGSAPVQVPPVSPGHSGPAPGEAGALPAPLPDLGKPAPPSVTPADPSPPPGTPADGTPAPTQPPGTPADATPPPGAPADGGGPPQAGTQPTEQSPGYWDVDTDKLTGFAMAVTSARFGLAAVQTRVERMQGDEYTPKLGTSPVGQQLAKKFDDRLNGEAGLRGLLAEAMRRMDEFIESAEKVRDAYRENEADAEQSINRASKG